MNKLRWFVFIGLICFLMPTYGEDRTSPVPTSEELEFLPKYCKYVWIISNPDKNNMTPQVAYWVDQLGDGFWYSHHYCFALNYINRSYLVKSNSDRLGMLNRSINEFDYVIRAAKDEKFVLLPEVHTKKGKALLGLGKGDLAEAEFRRSIELKSDYWPPYAYLSDYLMDKGRVGEAEKVLDEGLGQTPDAEALKKRKAALGKKIK